MKQHNVYSVEIITFCDTESLLPQRAVLLKLICTSWFYGMNENPLYSDLFLGQASSTNLAKLALVIIDTKALHSLW